MTVLQPFLAYPLHVQSWRRPAGSIDYRVTNPFGGIDLVNADQSHQGTDIGNTRENDVLRAPVTCNVRSHRHTDGALGLFLDLGGGWQLELWHLNAVYVPTTWTMIGVTQKIGLTGSSGRVQGAHTHVELKRSGKPVDAAPFLPMVEREALPIPGATASSYRFVDVPPSHPFYGDIEWMAEHSLSAGIGGGKYGPDQPVTRAELAAFLHRYDNARPK